MPLMHWKLRLRSAAESLSPTHMKTLECILPSHEIRFVSFFCVGLNLFFGIFRTGLMACHDFSFIAKGAVGSLVLVYVPAILMAKFVFKTPLSYYIAMYVPHVALLFVFGWRMWTHIQCMRKGRDGPWTVHVRKMSRVSSVEDSLLLGAEELNVPKSYGTPLN